MMAMMMMTKFCCRHDETEWWRERSLGLVQSEHRRKLS